MGGLNLCDLRMQHIALHLSWLPKIIDNTNFEYVYQWLDEQLGDLIWKCNLRHDHCKHVSKSNTFWNELLHTWAKLHHFEPQNNEEIRNQIIWYNSHVTIEGLPLKPKAEIKQKNL